MSIENEAHAAKDVDVAAVIEHPVMVVQLAGAQLVVSVFEVEIVLHSCVQTGTMVALHTADVVANVVNVIDETEQPLIVEQVGVPQLVVMSFGFVEIELHVWTHEGAKIVEHSDDVLDSELVDCKVESVGLSVGLPVGFPVGLAVGLPVGLPVGSGVGEPPGRTGGG